VKLVLTQGLNFSSSTLCKYSSFYTIVTRKSAITHLYSHANVLSKFISLLSRYAYATPAQSRNSLHFMSGMSLVYDLILSSTGYKLGTDTHMLCTMLNPYLVILKSLSPTHISNCLIWH
jgi:hypothetical protein